MNKSSKTVGKIEPSKEYKDAFPILVHYSNLEMEIKLLSGRVLTILDASFNDKQQNKAVKDLVKREIRDVLFRYQKECSDGKSGHSIPFNDTL